MPRTVGNIIAASILLTLLSGPASAQSDSIFGFLGISALDQKRLDCRTLVVTDVEDSGQQAEDAEVRIVPFDMLACERQVVPVSLHEIVDAIRTRSSLFGILEGNEAETELPTEELNRRLSIAKSRQSEYWRMMEPMAKFCSSLGVPAPGFSRYCNYGAYPDNASAATRKLLKIATTGSSQCCGENPINRGSASNVFADLLSPQQDSMTFSELAARLVRDGFSCENGEIADTCSKPYVSVQSGVAQSDDLLSFLDVDPATIPMPDTWVSIREMQISNVKNPSPLESTSIHDRVSLSKGIAMGPLPFGPRCGLPYFWINLLLNDIVPPHN